MTMSSSPGPIGGTAMSALPSSVETAADPGSLGTNEEAIVADDILLPSKSGVSHRMLTKHQVPDDDSSVAGGVSHSPIL